MFTINASSSSAPSAATQTWLQNALAASTAPWKVVFFHYAAWSSSGQRGDQVQFRFPYQAWGADMVMSGHDHHYERLSVNGFPWYVNGLGGRGHYSIGTIDPNSVVRNYTLYGAMRVTITPTTFRTRMISTSGVVIDDFTLTEGTPTPTATPIPPSNQLQNGVAKTGIAGA